MTSPRSPRYDPRSPRLVAEPADPRPVRPAPPPRSPGGGRPGGSHLPRLKPDPNPLRLLLGLAGLASASAITTALLPSVTPAADATTAGGGTASDVAVQPQPSVQHVTKYVVLQPGQTAPPDAPVIIQPSPTPRVHVVTVTKQSGVP